LHVTLQQAKSRNIFEGIKVGSTRVDVSHFQFVSDALIIGKWSHENSKNLYRILRYFELSSGLKVSFSKSMFFGLGASMAESNNLASSLGSKKGDSLLGEIKAQLLLGGSLDSNKMAWIGWKKVCSSDSRGGLGIGSLQASNLAMLSKWPIRGGRETDQFNNLNNILNDFNPSSDAPDTRDYVLHNSRTFSVLSMRKWIDATLSPDSNKD
ncbi:hypothetical protein Tco_1009343, partial [Tanacetum coccineum]